LAYFFFSSSSARDCDSGSNNYIDGSDSDCCNSSTLDYFSGSNLDCCNSSNPGYRNGFKLDRCSSSILEYYNYYNTISDRRGGSKGARRPVVLSTNPVDRLGGCTRGEAFRFFNNNLVRTIRPLSKSYSRILKLRQFL
jgi:hypothetical protein